MRVVMHRPDGSVYVGERPVGPCGKRQIRIAGAFGWISSGTEGGFLRRMRQTPSPKTGDFHLGYTASGTVLNAGEEASEFAVGAPVAVYGSPYVCHAEEQVINRNLAVPVPAGVALWEAAAAGLGAIALHGLRQIRINLGDVVVQYGLGPLGMLAGQLAEAMGAELIAVDLLAQRVDAFNAILPGRAHRADRVNLKDLVKSRTRGRGADAVVLAVSGSKALEENVADLLRDRGRISLLSGFEEALPNFAGAMWKEIEIKYVRAGGPGRRDPAYEVEGADYPVGYVPWTENRNMEAFLRVVAAGKVKLGPLVSHFFPLEEAPRAWDLVVEHPERTLGVVVGLAPGHPPPIARGDLK